MASYTTSLNIMEVYPILFSGESADKFEFNPPLVGGLTVNEQGRINGRPTESTGGVNRDTIVTAFIAGGSTRTCKYSYDTKDSTRPTVFSIQWNTNPSYVLPNNEIVLVLGWYFDVQFVAVKGERYRLPEYPSGGVGGDSYSFNIYGSFNGKCGKPYNPTVYAL